MGVDFRDIDGAVAQHILYVADIHVGFQQAGGESMAEHMRGDGKINAGKGGIFFYHPADGLI